MIDLERECNSCKSMWMDDRSPEMCGNEEAIEKLGRINYCEDYNPNKDCGFYHKKWWRIR